MPTITDFRTLPFSISNIQASGKFVGKNFYWKLYSIENIIRIIINSILLNQIGANWWDIAVDTTIAGKATRTKSQYSSKPWHSQPGSHGIYFVFLPDLNEIIRANSHLFIPIIPEIDRWIVQIEQIRLPRNIVGHMNWPSEIDGKRIDVLLSDLISLSSQIAINGLNLVIP